MKNTTLYTRVLIELMRIDALPFSSCRPCPPRMPQFLNRIRRYVPHSIKLYTGQGRSTPHVHRPFREARGKARGTTRARGKARGKGKGRDKGRSMGRGKERAGEAQLMTACMMAGGGAGVGMANIWRRFTHAPPRRQVERGWGSSFARCINRCRRTPLAVLLALFWVAVRVAWVLQLV